MSNLLHVGLAGRSYPIHIAAGALGSLDEHLAPLAPSSLHLVTDQAVGALYGPTVLASAKRVARTSLCTLSGGESLKTMATAMQVLDAMAASAADRSSVLLALGGGVVGDIAGFAAAIYMRGIRFVQLPTTLLAQVDSSVGGKTGVNHSAGKNLIGAFHQPDLVVADLATLKSLPRREIAAGLAEVIKHGLLADAEYFTRTVQELPALLDGDAAALSRAVARSCEIKAAVVGRDERESGERALLNLGHTFGHAIEALTGYGTWLHGEAVGCGLCLAGDLSARLGLIDAATADLIVSAVAAAQLPVRIAGLPMEAAIAAMRGDKKSAGGRIRFVLLHALGRAVLQEVPETALRATLRAGGYV